MLRRLGLLLPVDDGDIGHMDQQKIVASGASPELPQGLDEWHAFNVADRATQLDYTDIRLLARVVDGDSCHALDPILDCIGDMWYHLDGLTQVAALTLAFNHMQVDLARGDVVFPSESDV